MRTWRVMPVAIALLAVAAAGCGGEREGEGEREPAPAARASKPLDGPCPGTLPNGEAPAKHFNHGNRAIGVEIWPKGKLVAGPPDGSTWGTIESDGSIYAKLGWYRAVEGTLVVRGERLDAQAPPLVADVPEGYGASGFQATGLTFPTTGCWKVTGSVGDASLAFVVRVVKRR